ncbi:hypothetical protein PCASD_02473 [Puccinia coronata f. sp. avenae]|uniref:Uncharacterized protein n=1 Tax=Puccinia coronata f. sp. avenae TaxID=200324 RepID=A0A2N5VM68_9BASI|nr:hypothetical protein PCASD_02473 [Puccinia coronata f. sp. avenae]
MSFEATAHHSYLQAWASRLCQLRDFLVSYQETDLRHPSNAQLSQLNDENAAIQLRCKEIPQPLIQRSTDTLVQHAIFTELKAFEKQFLADGLLENQFSDLVDPDHGNMHTLHARIENFSLFAIGLINRLTKRFPTSVDILWPVQDFLNIMIADLTLTFQRAVARLSNPSTRVIAEFIGLLTTTTTAVAAANLQENANLERVQAAITDEASQSSMSLLCISAMSKYSIDEFDNSQTLKLLSFYDKIWNLWTRNCMRQQKEAEEKPRSSKHVGKTLSSNLTGKSKKKNCEIDAPIDDVCNRFASDDKIQVVYPALSGNVGEGGERQAWMGLRGNR